MFVKSIRRKNENQGKMKNVILKKEANIFGITYSYSIYFNEKYSQIRIEEYKNNDYNGEIFEGLTIEKSIDRLSVLMESESKVLFENDFCLIFSVSSIWIRFDKVLKSFSEVEYYNDLSGALIKK